MYKIIAATTELPYAERKKLKQWITFDRNGEYSETECFKKLEDAKKAFTKYKTEVTRLSDSGKTYYSVMEYMLINETDDDFAFLECSPMQFEVTDGETYNTVKAFSTYAEAEAYQHEKGDGKNLYISLG